MVAVRSADTRLLAAVQDVVGWLDGELVACAVGTAPVPAHVHVDSWAERSPGDPSWGPGVIRVTTGGADGGAPTVGGEAGGEAAPLVLPEQAGELADALAMRAASASSVVVGVLGAKGGVGASVTAALLARAVSEAGRSAGLVDLCGGLDVMLGIEGAPGPRWADLTAEAGPFPAASLVANLPRWVRVSVLAADARGTPDPASFAGVLGAVRRACRVVVLDLPRSASLDVLARCDVLLVVSGIDAASAAGLAAFTQRVAPSGAAPIMLVRREARAVAAAEPADLARWCGLRLGATLPHCATLRGDLARGLGPGERGRAALTRATRALAKDLGLT